MGDRSGEFGTDLKKPEKNIRYPLSGFTASAGRSVDYGDWDIEIGVARNRYLCLVSDDIDRKKKH
ncbi:MAG: hypothetical protein CVU49_02110 [Candidatus Cloacimonetes bacterium HGW-Cloacimonetes-2]|jgi:hypothetical protein|nr:MAG: hypothetical protein CVU49_02110 [Candidatus Cloacimonetes bacterium HGW-Cloacimonetes-2]